MICKCGYSFTEESLAATRGVPAVSKSYAVVRRHSYRKFMKHEVEAWTAPKKKHRLRAIGKAARFVGTMFRCPECDRLVLGMPDGDQVEFYVREEAKPCCSTRYDS